MSADLPAGFWAGWIVVITVVSLLGLCWVIYSIYFAQNAHPAANDTVWDENLREENNPAPMWWFWLIFALLIFSLVYLMLYPGLGSYKGILNWSQGGQLAESYAIYDQEFGPQRKDIAAASLDALHQNRKAMASAERLFKKHCAACHGESASGQANLFPDLNDSEWQWGNTPEQIEQSIRLGRQGVMPGWQPALGDQGVTDLTDFVLRMSQGDAPQQGLPGSKLYATYCAACHGLAGAGNIALGAPDLANSLWVYGDSEQAVADSIAIGRNGIMPAFDARFDDTQIRLLVAWLTLEQSKR